MSDIHTPYGVLNPAHADELQLAPEEMLDQQILAHSRCWIIVGTFIRCVSCGYSQKASDSGRHFPHDLGCRAITETVDFPWRQLAVILRQLPINKPTDAQSQNADDF